MNKIETIIYNIVRKNPALKQSIRNIYQGIFDFLPKKKNYFENRPTVLNGFYFGFHDVTPWNDSEDKMLAMKAPFDLRMPIQEEEETIGYFNFINGEVGDFNNLDVSKAWNWHKGCRLQWLDNERIIFNTYENEKLCSKIINTNSKETTLIPYPIDAAFKDIATSFSYERLERCMPGYGYPYSDEGYTDESAPSTTGLYLVDLKSGRRDIILSLKDIAISATGKIEKEYLHFVTHTEFSKDGRYISFLYRRIPKEGNYMKRRSMVGIFNRINNELSFLNSQESGSHYVWNDKNQLLLSGNYNGKNCYMLFDVDKGGDPQLVDPTHLNSDGHESFINETTFITDTYPDKRRMAKLYFVDVLKDTSKLIASVYSPEKFQTKDFKCHIACDLHPRVSPSGRYVCFDTPTSGVRSLAIMKI